MRAGRLVFLTAAAAAPLLIGCLPGDTRPPPAILRFTAEPSAADVEGVTTDDGWHITFERLLVSFGGEGVYSRDNLCNGYDNAGYGRLLDLTVPRRQKLGDAYALGACDLRFRLRPSGADALLGQGVTAQDLGLMRTQEAEHPDSPVHKTAYVRGEATRGDVTKRFAWSFTGELTLHDCLSRDGVTLASHLDLRSDDSVPLTIVFHGEELFRATWSDAGPLHFDGLAGADRDGDQEITLEELNQTPGPDPHPDPGEGPAFPAGFTFAAFLSVARFPRAFRLGDSGACSTEMPKDM